ncbi:hypothetical protein KZ820_18430 [Sphingomonas sp. RRHST34]|uniref:Uncharacterized protein n=1 Tax=Sphingomonas citri TaxID=2862499 RepID=A0ABS7BT01_9SPHN|nr:hypothetical protein [Sphingomonas citri]MBW6532724.1 hypothetical protein [Sphingomonas citri]
MSAGERECKFKVSDYYFRLTTEGVRLFSNRTCVHQTFRQVVDERADCAKSLPDYYTAEDMREHLAIIPSEGNIELEFTILETSAASIESAAEILKEALGASVAFSDTVSLLLYDLVVEENKTEVLTKLGLTAEAAARYKKSLKRTKTNVFPIR